MVILGVLILLLVAAATLAVLFRGGDSSHIDLGSFAIDTNVTAVFLTGAATLLLAVVGLWLMGKGLRRNRRKRAEMRTLRDRARRAEDADGRQERASGPESRPEADDHFDSTPRDS